MRFPTPSFVEAWHSHSRSWLQRNIDILKNYMHKADQLPLNLRFQGVSQTLGRFSLTLGNFRKSEKLRKTSQFGLTPPCGLMHKTRLEMAFIHCYCQIFECAFHQCYGRTTCFCSPNNKSGIDRKVLPLVCSCVTIHLLRVLSSLSTQSNCISENRHIFGLKSHWYPH